MAKIKMKYRDFELEIEGEESFVEGKIKDFPSVLDKVINNGENYQYKQIVEKTADNNHSLIEYKEKTEKGINEFLNEKKFNKDVDLALGIVYYLTFYGDKKQFTAKDIRDMLKKAKYSSEKNVADLINNNIKKGFVEETGNKIDGFKSFVLLNSGIKYVENFVPNSKKSKTVPKSICKVNRLTEIERATLEQISQFDAYNCDDIDNIKVSKNQKQIIYSVLRLIDSVHNNITLNSVVIYEFIRKLGLNIRRENISARLSEVKGFFDQCENKMFKLSNYGRTEINKLLNK